MNENLSTLTTELEQSIYAALETYSNVHRGSGHYSMATTRLYEKARGVVLEYLGLDKSKYLVVFCSPRNAGKLTSLLKKENYTGLSAADLGLSLGITAVAVRKGTLPSGIPFITGGGTARLTGPDWVVRAKAPARFESGTPAVINVIALARALQLLRNSGSPAFTSTPDENVKAAEIVYGAVAEETSGEILTEKLMQLVIGTKGLVPATGGERQYINLDHAASTPALEPVWEAYRRSYRLSDPIRHEITREVRSVISRFLNAPENEYDVIFTRNTTEAINLVAENYALEGRSGMEPVILNTLLEHNSNELPWRDIPGIIRETVTTDEEGFFDLGQMENILKRYNLEHKFGNRRISLVSVCGASNVLGSFNDLEKTARLVHRYQAKLLVDAAQWVAHRSMDMQKWGIDYLVFSGHKIYAPFGSGALVVRKGLLRFNPQEMKDILSSGEENTGGIAALGRSLNLLQKTGMDLVFSKEQALTARLLHGIRHIPGLTLYGISDPESFQFARKGGVVAFGVKGMMPDRIAARLAMEGIGIRYGCHCAHRLVKHIVKIPPWAEKLQRIIVLFLPKMELPGVARISLGMANTAEEIETLTRALEKITAENSQEQKKTPHSGVQQLTRKEFRQKMEEFVRTTEEKVFDSSFR